jgi:hypothetical protein
MAAAIVGSAWHDSRLSCDWLFVYDELIALHMVAQPDRPDIRGCHPAAGRAALAARWWLRFHGPRRPVLAY